MEPAKILTASFDDIVFEGRNKEYGAYQLRKTYERRLFKALIITAASCLLIGGTTYVKLRFFKNSENQLFKITDGPTISNIEPEKAKPLPPPPKIEPPKINVPKVKTIAFTTPVIVKQDIVDPPPMQADIATSRIDIKTQDGVDNSDIVVPVEKLGEGKGIVEMVKPVEKEPEIATFVQVEAAYPGGANAWRNFLERNLRPEVPVENGAAPGSYTVTIQFVVDLEGNVSDIKPITGLGYGMEQEAKRVIQRSGKWTPAFQNGRHVKAYRKQPVTFIVQEQ